jgi:hypothetical protein
LQPPRQGSWTRRGLSATQAGRNAPATTGRSERGLPNPALDLQVVNSGRQLPVRGARAYRAEQPTSPRGDGDSHRRWLGPFGFSRPSRPPRLSGIAKPGGGAVGNCAGGLGAGGVLGLAVTMNLGYFGLTRPSRGHPFCVRAPTRVGVLRVARRVLALGRARGRRGRLRQVQTACATGRHVNYRKTRVVSAQLPRGGDVRPGGPGGPPDPASGLTSIACASGALCVTVDRIDNGFAASSAP